MTEPLAQDRAGDVIEQLRQLWVMASEESIGNDIAYARSLAETVPPRRRAEADDFVLALERLECWLRDL